MQRSSGFSIEEVDGWLNTYLSGLQHTGAGCCTENEGVGGATTNLQTGRAVEPDLFGVLGPGLHIPHPSGKEERPSTHSFDSHIGTTAVERGEAGTKRRQRSTRSGGIKKNVLKELDQKVQEHLQQLKIWEEKNDEVRLKNKVIQEVIQWQTEYSTLISKGCPVPFNGWRLLSGDVKLRDWTGSDYVPYFKRLVDTVASLFLEESATGCLSPQVEANVRELVAEFLHVADVLFFHNPLPIYQVELTNLETGAMERPHPEFWLKVVKAAKLSCTQKKCLLHCYDLFVRSEKKISEEKRQLVEQLHSLVNKALLPLSFVHLHQHDEAHEVLEKLQANLQHTHFWAFVIHRHCASVVDAIQMAHMFLAAYPYTPETVGFMRCLVEEREQGSLQGDDI